MTTDAAIEKEIIAKGLTAPRVTVEKINAVIAKVEFSRPTSVLTLCVITLVNGFFVTGESACASPENFDEELGKKIAHRNAFDKIWALEGYLLKQRLFERFAPTLMDRLEDAKVEHIAMICHETNRAYCAALGDHSQQPWAICPAWQRESAVKGVEFHLANPEATASASHESWLAEKERTGWKFGPVKDAEKKEHPCFVPFNELPPAQQAKDRLFKSIVDALR